MFDGTQHIFIFTYVSFPALRVKQRKLRSAFVDELHEYGLTNFPENTVDYVCRVSSSKRIRKRRGEERENNSALKFRSVDVKIKGNCFVENFVKKIGTNDECAKNLSSNN